MLYSSAYNYLFTSVAYNGYEPKLPFVAILEIGANAFDLLAINCFAAFKSGLHYLNSRLTDEELADFCAVFPRLKVYFNYINTPASRLDNGRVSYLISILLKVITEVFNEAKRKMIFYLAHGGYFLFGDKNEFSEEAVTLAKAGYVVASINYRLIDVESSDTASMKAVIDAIHDIRAAVRYFFRDAKTVNKYGIDTDRIAIGGYSAGAVASLHYAYANTI